MKHRINIAHNFFRRVVVLITVIDEIPEISGKVFVPIIAGIIISVPRIKKNRENVRTIFCLYI